MLKGEVKWAKQRQVLKYEEKDDDDKVKDDDERKGKWNEKEEEEEEKGGGRGWTKSVSFGDHLRQKRASYSSWLYCLAKTRSKRKI